MDWESQKPGLALWEHENISGDITCLVFFYEARSEGKDTKVLNMYNIFNLQKRHCE